MLLFIGFEAGGISSTKSMDLLNCCAEAGLTVQFDVSCSLYGIAGCVDMSLHEKRIPSNGKCCSLYKYRVLSLWCSTNPRKSSNSCTG